MNRQSATRIELAQCTVRSWWPEDAPSIAEHANSRDVWLNVRDRFPHPYTLADAEAFLEKALQEEPEIQLAIDVDGLAVGGIGFMPQEDIERISAEIGYWLGESYWNRGILSEVLPAVTRFGFARLGLHRIFALPMADNGASVRVLEKAGYTLEGRLRECAVKDGRIVSMLLYSILESEVD